MSWFKKAQKDYLAIGHSEIEGAVIIWTHNGAILQTKQLPEGFASGIDSLSHEYGHDPDEMNHKDRVASGRIEESTKLGSFAPEFRANSFQLKRAINDLVSAFPDIKFIVFPDVRSNPLSLSDYYQNL